MASSATSKHTTRSVTDDGANEGASHPKEIYEIVMMYLGDATSVARLGMTCRSARDASQSDGVWEVVIDRPMPALPRGCGAGSWEHGAAAVPCLRSLSASAMPLRKGQDWRTWYYENFVRMSGIRGFYRYSGGPFNDGCCTEDMSGTLQPGSFRMVHNDCEEYSCRETVVQGTDMRWVNDHLELRGSTKTESRARGLRTKTKTGSWSSKVFLGFHCKKYYGELDEDFKNNEGGLVLFFPGLGTSYRQRTQGEGKIAP